MRYARADIDLTRASLYHSPALHRDSGPALPIHHSDGGSTGIGTKLNPALCAFIERQPVFFVATAAPDGRVNVSPKGMSTLRILGDTHIRWLNLSGSGNETAAHLRASNRMTLM